jgi:5-methylcytosine-specific restriction endonuclease McrA
MKTLKPRLGALPSRKAIASPSWRPSESSSSRGYDGRWRAAREAFLSKHPLCAYCAKDGILNRADVVDHIIPHKGDMRLFWDSENWQPLCKRCHDSVKKKEEYQPREPYSPIRKPIS